MNGSKKKDRMQTKFCSLLPPCLFLAPQGLFRLAAAASVVKRLKTCLDQGAVDHSEFSMDPHAVAGNWGLAASMIPLCGLETEPPNKVLLI